MYRRKLFKNRLLLRLAHGWGIAAVPIISRIFSLGMGAIPIPLVLFMFIDEDDSNLVDGLSTCNRCGNYTHGTCSCILNAYNDEEDIQAQEYCSICDGWCHIHDK